MMPVCRTAVHACVWFAKRVGELAAVVAVICVAGVCPLPCGGQTTPWNTNGSGIWYSPSGVNVGIGTASPSSKLQVTGGQLSVTGAGAGISVSPDANSQGYMFLTSPNAQTYGSSTVYFLGGYNSTYPVTGVGLGSLDFRNVAWGQGASIVSYATQTHTAAASGGELRFSTTANGSTSATERMRIGQDGNVGIGTASPAANLELWGGSPSLKITQNPGQPGNPSLSILPAGTNNTATINLSGAVLQASTVSSALFLQPTGGNVGIGTTNPGSYRLAVEGKIGAREVIVTNTGWSDYVFKSDYRLRPLKEIALYIKANHHLPDIPSEAEVAAG